MRRMLLILFSVVLGSCTSDNEPVIADAQLEGRWELTNVGCFCFFDPGTDFTLTELIFEPDDSKITIIHNGEYTFFREAGVHFYGGQADRIGFDDDRVYRFEIYGDLLTLTYQDNPQIADDEVFYRFKKKTSN